MKQDGQYVVRVNGFHLGAGPVAHINSLSEAGNAGHYSVAVNVDVIDPTFITQGPGLADLTNGTQAGAVSELINFILDRPVANDTTYGIGATKLYKMSSTAVTSDGTWPHAITGCTDGESTLEFQGAEYYFFNKSSSGDIGKLTLPNTFDDDWGSTVPTGMAALQKAPHPSAKKEDIMAFGNGRYFGTYVSGSNTLAPTKLDFGANTEIPDVLFHANQWHIAVNTGITTGTNRASSQIYLYDGGATTAILSDEVAVGVQQIGFLIVVNGIVHVAYKDISGYNAIGYVSGRRIIPLGYFSGNLPTYEKKTLYRNGILFESSGLLYWVGSATQDYPIALSQHADGGYATCGGLAAPFGTPMVSSTDGLSNQRLAKFSGYDTNSSWKEIVIPLNGALVSVDEIIVLTAPLGAGASCALTLEYNQAQSSNATAMTIAGTGVTRHKFTQPGVTRASDLRVCLDFSGGSTSNPVKIREIFIKGTIAE